MKVRLRNAWTWKCPNCGGDNVAEMEQLNEQATREALGLEPWEALPPLGGLCTAPAQVRCGGCRNTYDACPDGEEQPR